MRQFFHLPSAAVLTAICIASISAVKALPLAVLDTVVTAPGQESGLRWNELSAAQKTALKPLEREWATLDAIRKEKWLDVAARMPKMSVDERQRIQTRMNAWVAMTPAQRAQARFQFNEAEQVSPKGGRQAQWDVYQTLSTEQKRQLARQAARAGPSSLRVSERAAGKQLSGEAVALDGVQQKSNIVPNPALTGRVKTVAPALVQAAHGATTTLVTKRVQSPAHQQAGLPKIAGASNFVDPSTLLPQRGPQGAAVTASVASAPLPRP